MAIINTTTQHLLSDRKPLDSKSLVQTYAKLISESTWMVNGSVIAYNGMITAVWLDKENSQLSDKNGVYLLFDPTVTSNRGDASIPDVTNPAHWHKISDKVDLSSIEDRLDALEAKESVITYGYRSSFPPTGIPNVLYVASDEGASYVWVNNDYYEVGASDPDVIDGGDATNI